MDLSILHAHLLRARAKRGRAPAIWAVKGYTEEQIQHAHERHRQLIPKVSGLMLESYVDLVPQVKATIERLPPNPTLGAVQKYHPDMGLETLRLVCTHLQKEGLKIWM